MDRQSVIDSVLPDLPDLPDCIQSAEGHTRGECPCKVSQNQCSRT